MAAPPSDPFQAMAGELFPLVNQSVTPVAALPRGSNEPLPLGTGTLFAVGSTHFLVTAAHVLAKVETYGECGCAFGVGEDEDVGTRLHPVPLTGTAHRVDDPFDIGVIELDESSVSALVGRRFLRHTDVALRPEPGGGAWVVGFPQEYIRDVPARGRGFAPLSLATTILVGDDVAIENFDPECHFLLNADPSGLVQEVEGSPASLPRFYYGISGCAVWQVWWPSVDHWPTEWRTKKVKIVGVQTSSYRKPPVLKATYWGHVARLIYQQWPDLRGVLEMHFGRVFG